MGMLTEPDVARRHLDHWLEAAVKPWVSGRTYEDYKGLARRYIRAPLGDRLLTQLAPVDLHKLYSELTARGLAPRTVRYCHTVLHKAPSQAVRWCMIPQNLALHVDLPRKAH